MKRTTTPTLLALSALLALAACSGGEAPPARGTSASEADAVEEEPADEEPADEGPALSDEERLDPANFGAIAGRVTFEGDPPARNELSAPGKTPGCKHHDTPPLTEVAIVSDAGEVQNAFLYVRKSGLPKGFEVPAPPAVPAELDQLGCVYVPHVQGMQVGQELHIKNSDDLAHNVNCRSTRNQAINPTQAQGAPAIVWKPERREVMTRFECNIHNWMWAYVGVLEHPFFAVTGPDGSFRIEGLPPGRYELGVWHEKFEAKRKKMRVTVPAKGEAEVSVVLVP